jgi:transposase
MTELAERYAISRKAGYALVRRVEEYGVAGLQPQSRRPHTSPHRTPDHVAALLIAAKRAHPAWGPEMLLHWLKPRHREIRHVVPIVHGRTYGGQMDGDQAHLQGGI